MGSPLGDFIRARRDSVQPQSLGMPDWGRRRAPGLRRSDLAARAGVSVEYLTRLEQGRDRNPSVAVVNALADALALDLTERDHLRYLSKITGGECTAHTRPAPPRREVRPSVLRTLGLLEPGIAVVTNRMGDILARTGGFEAVTRGTGLLDAATPNRDAAMQERDAAMQNGDPGTPNLTRYVFTDPRARTFFADWDAVADERAFELWHGPSAAGFEWFTAELAPAAGPEFTRRLNRHVIPRREPWRLHHPSGCELELIRETLELPEDAQQLVVFLPADEATARAVDGLAGRSAGRLRAV
ncbi:helix-turn-helix domain-containing protein [Streptomyces arboris]|uniref:Helix-turn-helix domain-containing protein n=1 Tax=Streptomyces arboris TaxID=2600619 RepID=A0A5N5EFH8_9ACTN|nr:helix-turn-helix domain-containing protein [Streptomyces arboris]KAB2589536.1 helix-turn-helix domain-containing protein [Streptomyces arboris]